MPLHEIGYLIIGGVFQCWFWGPGAPCTNAEKIKPAGLSREQSAALEAREVYYEESGFAVYDQKGDQISLKKKTGEIVAISLEKLNQQTKAAIPQTGVSSGGDHSLWRFEPLEKILNQGMIEPETNFWPHLRQDDLKQNIPIPNKELQSLKQKRINEMLIKNDLSLPIGYFVTSQPCTYKSAGANSMSGQCAPPAEVKAYARPERTAQVVLNASLSWAHFEGRPGLQKPNVHPPTENSEELLVFEEKGDWVRMQLVVLDKSQRLVWVNKKDVPHKFVSLEESKRLTTLIEFLDSLQSERNENLAQALREVLQQEPELSLHQAGVSKWSDGVLWIKVNVMARPHCSVEPYDNTLATGWLPYFEPKTKQKILTWVSRGC